MSELHHECGVAAIYHLSGRGRSPMCTDDGPRQISRLLPRMLLDIQNRGQLAAGMTTYDPDLPQLLRTRKDVGSVTEVFRLNHKAKAESLMKSLAGRAAIGHVRYATCGADDRNYAQPFERRHIHKRKWFSFCFNGQLTNYEILKERLLADGDHHLTLGTDTEIILHEFGRRLSQSKTRMDWIDVLRQSAAEFDGAYSMAVLTAEGEMIVARDPLGIKPMCYVNDGPLFAAASESVALLNLGFSDDQIKSLPPGHAIIINPETGFRMERFAEEQTPKHCFFEWIYFANVASTLDDQSVYLSRTRLGEELARAEREMNKFPLDPNDTIIVPVPDTSKAAADSMAFQLAIPCREGLIRNRYAGRTFIEGGSNRKAKAATKYTPLREVLEGKRVILVEDSIVRSTTMNVLLDRIREVGGAREIHVRVACPPIIAPCFYGIDMSSIDQLIGPKYFSNHGTLTDESQQRLADDLGADSLRYLPVEAISRAIGLSADHLCQACVTGKYPTKCGQHLYQIALDNRGSKMDSRKTYEQLAAAMAE
ncbi:amidophosphoribosyltransferase [Rubripirellula amarantea]|uniref:Amidophosphoribosyltransferase n=1 Tax=Rubripirellula amarantea TaxID=2527999 RepID=A0A5C5WWU1_9BACT|nr:amidophosphoribosyltransferase [Rubripirellula amarantea]MDA8744662.1 amidophosphoribosyltransferase [Rubripirellula amarantea]TWT54415.1 Amidophosphoribosyltransferase [Rubripirellula amarantea]